MAKNNNVLVFDIGSSKIRAMVASQGVNNTFIIKSQANLDYAGFYEGRFLDEEGLLDTFNEVLEMLDFVPGKNNDKIYIGVPAEFSSVINTTASINFGEKKKIKKSDIDTLFYSASEKAKEENAEILTVCPILYRLDEGRVVSNLIGEQASSISAELSVIYAGRGFISIFNQVVGNLGFESVEYISEPLSEGLFCLSADEREDLNMIINVGDLTTSVSFVKGDGLVNLYSFSYGGGHITNDLSEAFELSLQEADKLKRQVVLSLKGKQNDFYELMSDSGKILKIPLNTANEVVGYRLDAIGSAIAQCLQLFSKEYIPYLPVSLTGSGVSLIKGGRDYLAKCLGRNISYGVPPLPGKEKPQNASILSLVAYALHNSDA